MNILLAYFITFFFAISCSALSPIILIPGDGGSQLEAILNKPSVIHYLCDKKTSDYFNIWLNKELLVPVIIDCWVDNMKLNYDNVTRKTINQPGVDIRVPGWGDPEPVEWLDPSHASVGAYFKDIANTLTSIGYVRNVSLRGAPYDFRKAPNENGDFFVKLKILVEETYKLNNCTRVTLLTHSMGGIMALYFLQKQNKQWKDMYIEKMITLSVPWGGAMKAIKVFAIGDDLGAFVLRQSILREEQITSPSLSWLLPSPLFWKDSEVLVQTAKLNYTLNNLQQFFVDLDWPIGWEMRKDTLNYTMDFSSPGVDLHCLYGTQVDTVEKLVYKPGVPLRNDPVLLMGDGDGTVNLRSLEGCRHWSQKRKNNFRLSNPISVKQIPLPKVDHLGILSDARSLKYIKDLMSQT